MRGALGMSRIRLLVAACLLALVTGGVGRALAQNDATLAAATDLPVFAGSYSPDGPAHAELAGLGQRFAAAPAGSLVSAADFDQARPVGAPGGGRVWLVPTSDGDG